MKARSEPEMNELLPRPRSVEAIRADIHAQAQVLRHLNDLALDFINLDTRSLVWDGAKVEKIGPDPVPPELRYWIADESMRMATLMNEFREAIAQDRDR